MSTTRCVLNNPFCSLAQPIYNVLPTLSYPLIPLQASATDIEGGHTDAEENTDGGEPGETSTPPPEKKKKDPSTYTLVEAAQYGVLDRCRELVEHKRKDVTRGDEENITVLHWAAINNRIAVAR